MWNKIKKWNRKFYSFTGLNKYEYYAGLVIIPIWLLIVGISVGSYFVLTIGIIGL